MIKALITIGGLDENLFIVLQIKLLSLEDINVKLPKTVQLNYIHAEGKA